MLFMTNKRSSLPCSVLIALFTSAALLAGEVVHESCVNNISQPIFPTATTPDSMLLSIPPSAPTTVNRQRAPLAVTTTETLTFSDPPTEQEITNFRVFPERLTTLGVADNALENRAILAAMQEYLAAHQPTKTQVFDDFIKRYPTSAWNAALLTNLGLVYRRYGFFTKAITYWERVRDIARHHPQSRTDALIGLAYAELAQINAWLGRADELDQLFADAGNNVYYGVAKEKLSAAQQGRKTMLDEPGIAFKCGPYALERIRRTIKQDEDMHPLIAKFNTKQTGTNLTEVRDLSLAVGTPMIIVHGEINESMPTPAILHWKLNHFSALLEIKNNHALIQDNTLDAFGGREAWIPLEALKEEASGYCLILKQALHGSLRAVPDSEGQNIYGKGYTGPFTDVRGTSPCDTSSGGSGSCSKGMATYSFHSMLVSLNITDTPLFYAPPRGPQINFTVTYNEKEASQPVVFTYSNFGSRWSFNWIDYIIDDPANNATTQKLERSVAGGGGYQYSMTQGVSAPQRHDSSVLRKISANSYEMTYPDGSKSVYSHIEGFAYPRRVFLTRMVDVTNNGLDLIYQNASGGVRLTQIVDSLGQITTLSYDHTDPLKITAITDPFSRSATFGYGANNLLSSIRDAVGIISSFTYSSSDVVAQLTTPYGDTTFRRGTGPATDQAWLEATDPHGDTERLEFNPKPNGIANSIPKPPPDRDGLDYGGSTMSARNSFYWDKKAFRYHNGDYTKAVMYHWLHTTMGGGYASTGGYVDGRSRILECIKTPLEGFTWFHYPGQTAYSYDTNITLATPRDITRILDDGTIQNTHYTFTSNGQIASMIDPAGRTTEYIYAANGIDLLTERQRINATTTEQLVSATYNAQHLPLTITDAAGQTTNITYNNWGQPLTITNAKNEVTTLIYNGDGYLTTVRDPTLTDNTFAYDGYGRVRTATGSDGYAIVTDYDQLNRPLRITYPDNTFDQIVYYRLDPQWIRDRQGRWTYQVHDALRKLTATRDALGRQTIYKWCRCGHLEDIIDPMNRITSWDRDVQGRPITKTFPDGRKATYAYQSASGRLSTITDALGQITQFNYFIDNKISSVAYTSAARPTTGVSYLYDAVYGRLSSMSDSIGATGYSYHPIAAGTLGAGQLASIDGPLANDTVTFAYDQLGRQLSRSLGLGNTVGSTTQSVIYDALGRVSTSANELGSFSYAYEGATSRLKTLTMPGGLTTTINYFNNLKDFRLQNLTHARSGGGLIASHAYTYATSGAITSWALQTDSAGSSAFAFTNDDTDQLLLAERTGTVPTGAPKVSAFRYDTAGNRLTTQSDNVVQTHNYNNLNQLTQTTAGGVMRVEGSLDELATVTVNGVGAQVTNDKKFVANVPVVSGNNTLTILATDANGNVRNKQWQLTGITGVPASPTYDFNGNCLSDGTRTFEWDAKNQLKAITIGTTRSEFFYDGFGRRVRMLEKQGVTIVSDRRFVWVGTKIVQERDASNNLLKQFSGQGVVTATATLLYLRDHLGSIREIVDTSGNVRARYDYDVYGKRRKLSGDLDSDFGYTGHFEHVPSGMTLTLYRGYDSGTGRWISRDPIGENGGINLYGYVYNNPINDFDEYGLAGHLAVLFSLGVGTGCRLVASRAGQWALAGGGAAVVAASRFIVNFNAGPRVYSVYTSVQNGVTRYVGITNDVIRRGNEHVREAGRIIQEIPGLTNLTRAEARAVEQALITHYGKLKDSAGCLQNAINSVNPLRRDIHKQFIDKGIELLNKIGYESTK